MTVIVRNIHSAYGNLVNSAKKRNNTDKLSNVKKPHRVIKVVVKGGKTVSVKKVKASR